jgi:hypothetical protein
VSDRHVIAVKADRQASYEAYFQLQDAIVRAYAQLRNELARKQFGKPLVKCTADEREAIGMVYPQRISEDTAKGGQP